MVRTMLRGLVEFREFERKIILLLAGGLLVLAMARLACAPKVAEEIDPPTERTVKDGKLE